MTGPLRALLAALGMAIVAFIAYLTPPGQWDHARPARLVVCGNALVRLALASARAPARSRPTCSSPGRSISHRAFVTDFFDTLGIGKSSRPRRRP